MKRIPPPVMNNTTITTATGDKSHFTIELCVVLAILSIFCALGTIGNAVVLYVFGRRKEKLTSNIFILTLAGTDFVTCLVVVPFTICIESIDYKIKYDFMCKLYNFLITSNVPFSAFIMVAIAVDRYLCICHPFLHAMNTKRAKLIIAGLALLATTLGIITSLAYGVYIGPTDQNIFHNATGNAQSVHGTQNGSVPDMEFPTTVIYTGECSANYLIVSDHFRKFYQKLYAGMFLLSLVIVGVLYGMIYRSVFTRRAARQRQKSQKSSVCAEPSVEETQLTVVNGNGNTQIPQNGDAPKEKRTRKVSRKDRNRMANLKTACMLFVVTLVFVICFLPAWLMAHKLLPMSRVVFYMYFMYNVANPIIYAFMNQTFRDDLQALFRCQPTRV